MATTLKIKNDISSITLTGSGSTVGYSVLDMQFPSPQPTRAVVSGGILRHGDDILASTYRPRQVKLRILVRGSSSDDLALKITALSEMIRRSQMALQEKTDLETYLEYQPGSLTKKFFFYILDGVMTEANVDGGFERGIQQVKVYELDLVCEPFVRGEATGIFSNLGRNTHFEIVDESVGDNTPVGYSKNNVTAYRDSSRSEFPDKRKSAVHLIATGGSATNNNITEVLTWAAGNAYRGRVFTILARYKWNPVSATEGWIVLHDGTTNATAYLVSSGTPSADTGVWRWATATLIVGSAATAMIVRQDVRTANSLTTGADELVIDHWMVYERPLIAMDNFTGTTGYKLEHHICNGYGPITPQLWNVTDDGWTIQTNKAGFDGGVANQVAQIETFKSDIVLECDVTTSATSTKYPGLAFRYQDSANFLNVILKDDANILLVQKMVNGTLSTLDSQALTIAATTTYTVRVLLQGTSIQVYVAGVLISNITDTTFQTQTRHGLYAQTTGVTDYLWDNFKIRDYATTDPQMQDFWVDGTELINRDDQEFVPATDPQRIAHVDMYSLSDAPCRIKMHVLEDQAKVNSYGAVIQGALNHKKLLVFEAETWNPVKNFIDVAWTSAIATGGVTSQGTATNNVYKFTYGGASDTEAIGAANYLALTLPDIPPGIYIALVHFRNASGVSVQLAGGYSYGGRTLTPTVSAQYTPLFPTGGDNLLVLPRFYIEIPDPKSQFLEAPGTLELRVYFSYTNIVANSFEVDYVLLLPALNFIGHDSAVAAAQYTVYDQYSKSPGIIVETVDRVITTIPSNPWGRLPLLSPEPSRVYLFGNNAAAVNSITDTRKVEFQIIPQFLHMRP